MYDADLDTDTVCELVTVVDKTEDVVALLVMVAAAVPDCVAVAVAVLVVRATRG